MILSDKILISTRPVTEEDTLKKILTQKGATVLDTPMIKVIMQDNTADITYQLNHLSEFDLLSFTSKNGVRYFIELLKINNIGLNELSHIKIACFGSKTIEETERIGIKTDINCLGESSDVFLKTILNSGIKKNSGILLVLGNSAPSKLEEGLGKYYQTERINVYKTLETGSINDDVLKLIKNSEYDLLLFTSPSGFRSFLNIMGKNKIHTKYKIGCIGKTTAFEVKKFGFNPLLVSRLPDAVSFANEIENYFKN